MNFFSRYTTALIRSSRQQYIAASLVMATGFFSSCVQAESWQFDAGFVVVARQQQWLDIAADQQLLPLFVAHYGNWQFGTTESNLVSYRWQLPQQLSLELGAGIRDLGYGAKTQPRKHDSQAPVFQGYQRPDPEAVVNVALKWHWFSLQLGHQLDSEQLALQAKAGVQIPLWHQERGANLALRLEARYLNEELAQRLYGVDFDNRDLRVGRPQFSAPSAINPAIALQLTYPLTTQWLLLATLSAEQLDTELQASPLVGRERSTELLLVANYRF